MAAGASLHSRAGCRRRLTALRRPPCSRCVPSEQERDPAAASARHLRGGAQPAAPEPVQAAASRAERSAAAAAAAAAGRHAAAAAVRAGCERLCLGPACACAWLRCLVGCKSLPQWHHSIHCSRLVRGRGRRVAFSPYPRRLTGPVTGAERAACEATGVGHGPKPRPSLREHPASAAARAAGRRQLFPVQHRGPPLLLAYLASRRAAEPSGTGGQVRPAVRQGATARGRAAEGHRARLTGPGGMWDHRRRLAAPQAREPGSVGGAGAGEQAR